jgi:hypothetical protein
LTSADFWGQERIAGSPPAAGKLQRTGKKEKEKGISHRGNRGNNPPKADKSDAD